jgi:methyl-accepting chemotaxis protein
MKTIANIKIGKKIGFVLAATIVLLAGLSALSLWALHFNEHMAQESVDRLTSARLAETIAGESAAISQYMGKMIIAKTTVDDLVNQIVDMRKVRTAALAQFKASANNTKSAKHAAELADLVKAADTSNDGVMTWLAAELFDQATAEFNTSSNIAASMHAKAKEASEWQRELVEAGETMRRKNSTIIWIALIGGCLFTTLAAGFGGVVLTRGIAGPLQAVVANVERIADGDLSQHTSVELRGREDEIGVLARAMQTMTTALQETVQEISGGIGVLSTSSTELMATSTEMTAGSHNASEKAHAVSAAAEQMSSTIESVAAAMEQTSTNLSHVATATEQMTSTIDEIAHNSETARGITDQASRQAEQITQQMNELGAAAREIGKVTETINEISSQTNLLALNATIEAARAGAAGKGFAVVATEIKALAQQTAAATEEIKGRIAGVQSATAGGIAEIGKISQVIKEVNGIVTSIAAAIEEQSITTRDIAKNIGQASLGVNDANIRVSETSERSREIAADIISVDRSAGETATGSGQVREKAAELSSVADGLRATVGRFTVDHPTEVVAE